VISMMLKETVCKAAQLLIDAGLESPRIGLVLGSGFAQIAKDLFESPKVIDGNQVPGLPHVQISGHSNMLIGGRLHDVPLLVFGGRKHLYEQVPLFEVIFPVLLLSELGAEGMILSNAAGAVNPTFHVGQLMLIVDHIETSFGSFADELTRILHEFTGFPHFRGFAPYSDEWLTLARNVGKARGLDLAQGIYCMNRGPFYETPAEVRACRHWGGDAVGMSTVPEALAASQLGLKVLGVSGLTNMATGLTEVAHTHEDVKEQAGRLLPKFQMLIDGFIQGL